MNIGTGIELKQFIKAFGGSLDPRLWLKLIEEEYTEMQAESFGSAAHLKEVADVCYVLNGFHLTQDEGLMNLYPDEEAEKWANLFDEVNEVLAPVVEQYGAPRVNEAFKRVHESNMSKLGEDGKPIRREDGKVLKGPNYKAPDLSDLALTKQEEAQ